MCFISVLNGGFFFQASRCVMQRGIEGVENQAALLFIPILWIMAAAVLIALNLYTLISGRNIRNEHRIHGIKIFYLAGLNGKELFGRVVFFGIVCLLMLFGYSLFGAGVWSVAYALSGGFLLICLYIWKKAGAQKLCG